MKAIAQLNVYFQRMGQLKGSSFIGIPLGAVLLSNPLLLLVQQHHKRLHLFEVVEAQTGFIHTHRFQLQFPKQFRVVDLKDEALVGHVRLHHHFHQPLGGMHLLGALIKFLPEGLVGQPGAIGFLAQFVKIPPFLVWPVAFQSDSLLAGDQEQRIARHTIQRLDAAAQQDGQFTKSKMIEPFIDGGTRQ